MTRLIARSAAAVLLVVFLAAVPAARAADDVYLRLDGIEGDVTDRDHPGWIRALAVGSSVARPTGNARPVFSDLSILKGVDSASPLLLVAIATGKLLRDAEIAFVRPGESGFTYFRIVLDEVGITGLRGNANPVAGSLTEFLTLSYARITWEYTPQGPGGELGTKVTGCWDIARSQSC